MEIVKCTTCKLVRKYQDRLEISKRGSDDTWFDVCCPKCKGKTYIETKGKCYVLMVATQFPKKHISVGNPTNFPHKIESGEKIHTIRGNYELWKKRIAEVKAGTAYISVRIWDSMPYKSKQKEIKTLTCEDLIDVVPVEKRSDGMIWFYQENVDLFDFVPLKPIGNKNIDLAKNDGLEYEDFVSWFKGYKINEPMALIYFGIFRY